MRNIGVTVMSTGAARTHSRSAVLHRRARQRLPGGCSRNTILRDPHLIYADRGNGHQVFDIDGNRYVDFSNNMASLIHGHAHPAVVGAVTEQLQRGSAFMMGTKAEVEFAEHMCSRCQSFEQIRFMNSGTEAVMSGIKAARAYTGRPMIAKAEGAYHGGYDYAEVSQASSPENWGSRSRPNRTPVASGTPAGALSDVVVFPFNDMRRAEQVLDQYASELACVLVDPIPHRVGLIPAQPPFLHMLRRWTRDHGSLLVFDEVVTFRTGVGGAQEVFGVTPDLTALGKMIGGGFPIGALAGSRKAMSVMDPDRSPIRLPQAGTFSANPISMTAGRVAMQLFGKEEIARVNELGARLRDGLRQAASIAGVPVSITGVGSMFRIHMKDCPPGDYREAFAPDSERRELDRLLNELLERGYLLVGTGTGAISTPMSSSVIDNFSEQCLDIFRQMRKRGTFVRSMLSVESMLANEQRHKSPGN